MLDILVDATAEHLIAQIAAGAEVVQIFDTWASAVPDEVFERLVVGPTSRIVEALRAAAPDVPVIGFPRGCGANYERYVQETGVDAVSLDSSVSLQWAADRLGRHVVLQGNLDPALLVVGGTPMIERATAIKNQLDGTPFIFNLGHGIVPSTPPQNVETLVHTIRGA